MPQYLLLVYTDETDVPAMGTPERDAQHAAWFRVTEELREAGHLVAGDALHPVASATTVRERDGGRLVTDGPFAETREQLGGYYLIDVPDLDTAIDWAGRLPNVTYGSVEVRPVVNFMAAVEGE